MQVPLPLLSKQNQLTPLTFRFKSRKSKLPPVALFKLLTTVYLLIGPLSIFFVFFFFSFGQKFKSWHYFPRNSQTINSTVLPQNIDVCGISGVGFWKESQFCASSDCRDAAAWTSGKCMLLLFFGLSALLSTISHEIWGFTFSHVHIIS